MTHCAIIRCVISRCAMKRCAALSMMCVVVAAFGTMSSAAQPTTLNVAIGKVSEVVFPQKIAKVIKGGMAGSVLVEVLNNSLYVLPKTATPPDIFVTSVAGESYPITLVIAPQHDIRVEIQGTAIARNTSAATRDVVDLMRELLRGNAPAGAMQQKSNQEIVMPEGAIRLKATVLYEFPHVSAYVLTAANLTDDEQVLSVEGISFPGLLAVASDADTLMPKGSEGDRTRVYLITEK